MSTTDRLSENKSMLLQSLRKSAFVITHANQGLTIVVDRHIEDHCLVIAKLTAMNAIMPVRGKIVINYSLLILYLNRLLLIQSIAIFSTSFFFVLFLLEAKTNEGIDRLQQVSKASC